MKIGIIGAGAVGGYYGAGLARAGEDVHLIARGETLRALTAHGLTVVRDDETYSIPHVFATDDPQAVGPVELALVTTKAYDLEGAGHALRVLKSADTIVVPLENGIDVASRLGALTDPRHILGGLTYITASVREPGVVCQMGPEKPLMLGPLDDADEDAAQVALRVLRHAGINAQRPADIRVALWTKFIGVAAAMGVQSITGQGFGPTRADPDTRALYQACMQEVAALAVRSGVNLPEGTPEFLFSMLDSYPAEAKASMLQDLERGKPIELEGIHGTVVRLGEELGVPTPVTRTIYAALKLRSRQDRL